MRTKCGGEKCPAPAPVLSKLRPRLPGLTSLYIVKESKFSKTFESEEATTEEAVGV